jgi:hypothetical protein
MFYLQSYAKVLNKNEIAQIKKPPVITTGGIPTQKTENLNLLNYSSLLSRLI